MMQRTNLILLLLIVAVLFGFYHFSYAGSPPSVELCLAGHIRSANCDATIRNFYQHEPAITQAALAEGIDPALLKAMVAVESRYNSQAVSPKGALGLMQVMPGTGSKLGVPSPSTELRHPGWNLAAGARYIAQMWMQFRDWRLALAAYNAGPGAVLAYRGIPPYPETVAYVQDVLHLYRAFKSVESEGGAAAAQGLQVLQ